MSSWLSKQVSGIQILCFIFSITILGFVNSCIWALLYTHFRIFPQSAQHTHHLLILSWCFPAILLLHAMKEELIFRLPLIMYLNIPLYSVKYLIMVCVVFSVIFALLHGSYLNIPSQGLSSMLLYALFVKVHGYNVPQEQTRPFTAYIAVSIAHFLHNSLSAFLLICLHCKYF